MDNIILKKDGKPFPLKAPAVKKAKHLGPDYEVIEVEGGYAIKRIEYPEPTKSIEELMQEDVYMEEVTSKPRHREDPEDAEEIINKAPAVHVKEESDVIFFSERDVGSEYPAWYFPYQIRELEEEIARERRRIDRGEVPPGNLMTAKYQVEKLERKLEEIKASKPRLSGKQKDKVAEETKYLGEKIREGLLDTDEMHKGIHYRPQDELKRMLTPYIKFKGKMLNRKQAEREWKIRRRLLGEDPRVELLRPRSQVAPGVIKLQAWDIKDYI